MPMPRMPLSADQTNELFRGFTTWMIHSLPADWQHLFITFRVVDGEYEMPTQVLTVLGASRDWTAPEGTLEYFLELRDLMRSTSGEMWTEVRYHLPHPNRYSAEYSWPA